MSHFELDRSDSRIRVHRREAEICIDACVHQTYGNVVPSIMVWSAFHFGGKSELVIVEGPMNQQVYRRVLRQNLLPWTRDIFRNNFVVVQDNAPPRKERAAMIFHENQDVEVMEWPTKSAAMNPIEHIWDQMSIHIRDIYDAYILQPACLCRVLYYSMIVQ